MKKQSVRSLTICLRICFTTLILSVLSLFLFSFITTTRIGDELWKQLGTNKQQGTEGIYRSFTGGYLYFYEARNAKNIAISNRLGVAKDLLDYAKQYINSEGFKNEYAKERAQAKPQQPEAKQLRTRAQIQKEEIEKTRKAMKEMEDGMKALDAEMKKNMQPVLDMYKKMLQEYEQPNSEYFNALVLNEKMEQERRARDYEQDMERWEENYPVDFKPIIRKRLEEFLEKTSGIDFDAELKAKYGKKVFVNSTFEGKPTEWKQAFRAGKEVTEYARSFAQKWLTEIK